MSSPTVYQPLVYWAQTEKTISLKVDLNDVSVSYKALIGSLLVQSGGL